MPNPDWHEESNTAPNAETEHEYALSHQTTFTSIACSNRNLVPGGRYGSADRKASSRCDPPQLPSLSRCRTQPAPLTLLRRRRTPATRCPGYELSPQPPCPRTPAPGLLSIAPCAPSPPPPIPSTSAVARSPGASLRLLRFDFDPKYFGESRPAATVMSAGLVDPKSSSSAITSWRSYPRSTPVRCSWTFAHSSGIDCHLDSEAAFTSGEGCAEVSTGKPREEK